MSLIKTGNRCVLSNFLSSYTHQVSFAFQVHCTQSWPAVLILFIVPAGNDIIEAGFMYTNRTNFLTKTKIGIHLEELK